MKTVAVMLLALLAGLAEVTYSLPASSVEEADAQLEERFGARSPTAVHAFYAIMYPAVLRQDEDPLLAEELHNADSSTQSAVAYNGLRPQIRERRSPRDDGRRERGNVDVSVHRERGVGTVVSARGEGNVWSSRDGRSRVDAHGEWNRVVRGPARSRPNYNAGVTFRHRF